MSLESGDQDGGSRELFWHYLWTSEIRVDYLSIYFFRDNRADIRGTKDNGLSLVEEIAWSVAINYQE